MLQWSSLQRAMDAAIVVTRLFPGTLHYSHDVHRVLDSCNRVWSRFCIFAWVHAYVELRMSNPRYVCHLSNPHSSHCLVSEAS
jgi:hypothetical protein